MSNMPKPKPVLNPKPGLSAVQYNGKGLDLGGMKPKLATKDKILNPVKKAVGLGHMAKVPKLVPMNKPKGAK